MSQSDIKDCDRESDEWFSLASYLATSARAGLEESVLVSSHRMVEALRQLISLVPELYQDPFYREIEVHLSQSLTKAYLKSPHDFEDFLDDLLQRFAAEARTRNRMDE